MSPLRVVAAALAFAALAGAAAAQEAGRAEFRTVGELAGDGFATVPASAGNAVFGMRKEAEIYLCFLADTPALQSERQRAILAWMDDGEAPREVPNIPLVCVLTE
jgi:hypothetical protein